MTEITVLHNANLRGVTVIERKRVVVGGSGSESYRRFISYEELLQFVKERDKK